MAPRKHILIAEDEQNISDFLKHGLENSGYGVSVSEDGSKAWKMIQTCMDGNRPDILLLDIRMPGMSGLELCSKFREDYGFQVPVLILTALGTTDDIVDGLRAGADDYMPKPFKFVELLARIEALIRRSAALTEGLSPIRCGNLTCDPSTHKATRDSITVNLSTTEYRLLEYFIRHQGEILSRRQLLKDVWDKDFNTNTNIVDVYVRYIRNKIDDPFKHKMIHTIVGMGYIMKE